VAKSTGEPRARRRRGKERMSSVAGLTLKDNGVASGRPAAT
jgi:hypothetical protein